MHNLDLAARERAEGVGGSTSAAAGDEERRRLQGHVTRQRLVAHSTAMESIQATSDPVDIPTELP